MVSTHGRVMRVAYTYTRADGLTVRLPSKLFKPGVNKSGYPVVHVGKVQRVDKQGKFQGCRPCRLATQRVNARVGVYTEADIQELSDEIYADRMSVESTPGQMMLAL
jgi:hypothetical protein